MATRKSLGKYKGKGFLGQSPAPGPSAPQYQQVPFTAADYAGLPLLRSPEREKALVQHVLDRVKYSNDERNRRASRAQMIDVQLSGYISLSDEDRKRKQGNESGKSPKPTDHNLPLADAQIDDCVTYCMSVFAPEMDLFEAVAPADKQQAAQALTYKINKDGQKGKYYRQFVKAITGMLRYNFGGFTCYWEKHEGVLFKGAPGGITQREVGTIWEGNVINSVDVYNFGYDVTVHPCDLSKKGEYFWEVSRTTPWRVRKMARDKELFGIGRYITELLGSETHVGGNVFYKTPPSVRDDEANDPASGTINWVNTLRAADTPSAAESVPGIELVKYTGWINPKEFGLSKDDDLQVWRLIVANGRCLTFAAKLEDVHGMLPVAIGCPLEDDLRNEQRTYAEKLMPMQHFASFLFNAHVRATRKSIYGINVYNSKYISMQDVAHDDMASANIPFRSTETGMDIDKAFRHYNAGPETRGNVQDVALIIELMQKILPTDMTKQVADLERATLYQAAATVQSGNRRQLKIARMISDQAIVDLKFQMIYNLYANAVSIRYVNPEGQVTTISVAELVSAELEYEIGTGLKGIDRLITIQIIRDVINALIQSQQGIAEVDIVSLLNYFTTLAGDRTDLRQFRRGGPGMPPVSPQPGGTAPPQAPPSAAQMGQPGQ